MYICRRCHGLYFHTKSIGKPVFKTVLLRSGAERETDSEIEAHN